MAASSLQDVLTPVITRIEAQVGVTVRVAYAASSTLARQIQAGAPADIFLSADVRWMDELAREQRIDPAFRAEAIGNSLVLICTQPMDTAFGVQQLAKHLGDSGKLVLADPAHVPAGRYARDALQRAGVWQHLSSQVVLADNVRAALTLVDRGEAKCGVVYNTDVQLAPGVHIAAHLAPNKKRPIRYSFALLASAPHPDARRAFELLVDDDSLAMFATAGFLLP
ncbi:MAG: molybdate ABC transporter substrate-binding protein [Gammaproteobacteria bacterium]